MRRRIWAPILGFVLVFVLVFFGVQFLTKTGVFRVPGVVSYDESLSEDEIKMLSEIFTDEVVLDADVSISAREVFELPELSSHEFLYEIYVPVANFYKVDGKISIASVDEFFQRENQEKLGYEIYKIENLNHKVKLLKLNDKYYLDDFKSGAVFRIISFESEKFEQEILPLVSEKMARDFPSAEMTLTFAQTGVTALSRGMNAKLYSVGNAEYFAENIGEYLSSFDLTHTSNESSFTDFASTRNICSDKRFINTLTAIGLDIVELTGNHNQDCGDQAALETIDVYNEKGILTVGGGKTAEEAARPLEIEKKNNNMTMLAFNLSTGGATYDNTPGANQYYEETAAAQIKAAKERGDTVIVDIQYYECNAYASEYEDPICDYANSAAGDQIGFFRHLIDLGADVVVGTSAHQPQTFEVYGDGVIYYGLGNLFFDQVWWPGTTRSLILVHHIYNNEILQTEVVPTVYGDEMQTRLMDEETAQWFLNRLVNARPTPAAGSGDLQGALNSWTRSVGGSKGVIFYDLDSGQVLASYNPDEKFATASIYKLFVVYEGYRRLQNGTWNGEDQAGSTGKTIAKCLDLAIRESNSTCAETLWAMMGRETLDAAVQNDFGLPNVTVGSLSATPREIMLMMKRFYEHPEITNEDLAATIKDSFLNQPPSYGLCSGPCNWRQGLPSGFSDKVLVYNKVGWNFNGSIWTIYDDAAILEFPEKDRHIIAVVMTSGIHYNQIRNLASLIENVI